MGLNFLSRNEVASTPTSASRGMAPRREGADRGRDLRHTVAKVVGHVEVSPGGLSYRTLPERRVLKRVPSGAGQDEATSACPDDRADLAGDHLVRISRNLEGGHCQECSAAMPPGTPTQPVSPSSPA